MAKRVYQFTVDGRAAGPVRQTKNEAYGDAVKNGFGFRSSSGVVYLYDEVGAEVTTYYIGVE